MQLRKLSGKQKIVLLILGIAVLITLVFTGKLFQKEGEFEDQLPVANEELLILGICDSVEDLERNQVYTDKGIYIYEKEMDWSPYLYQSVQAVTEENRILHINNLLQREVKLENCLITENSTNYVTIFSEGYRLNLPCKNLETMFSNEIADIHLTNGNITKISTKKEHIAGKIFQSGTMELNWKAMGLFHYQKVFVFMKYLGITKKNLRMV